MYCNVGEKMKNEQYGNTDICVCCGNPVPEGMMVCNVCNQATNSTTGNKNSKKKNKAK